MQLIGAILFVFALLHTFSAKAFERLSHKYPRHGGLLHLLGEVEVVFGFWAMVLLVAMACVAGPQNAIAYAETQQYTEPLFVFVVMVVAASKPVLDFVQRMIDILSGGRPLLQAWMGLALVPLAGSLITEPAAMTLAALMLAPQIFRDGLPEWQKYAALGVLFVNVSVGGTLTAYAAPPVLMVAATWQWDSAFMAANFGWKATLAVLVNASALTWLLRNSLQGNAPRPTASTRAPLATSMIHLAFLAAVVMLAHHPVLFLGLFLFFLGFTSAYPQHQSPLILKEALLVGFFLAGLVVLGSMQQWWLQPIVESLQPLALFFGALGLTAITDNAALTYLGSLIDGIQPQAQYMLVAGAVAGGGLTVIANAPNPAGVALLRKGFRDESIGALGLLAGALAPTAVAAAAFFL
ncbi:putative Na+/H+ antiporter [Pseudoduganella violaceinigra]|uniref:putative Na+/H+ antiporter n=1 Tax=Pseudoduganella violaceinigra TaxID=246602 RepID=UPI0004059372|nr:putative Na+/H+ antiporter [Pseudoduganella violaceinigra]